MYFRNQCDISVHFALGSPSLYDYPICKCRDQKLTFFYLANSHAVTCLPVTCDDTSFQSCQAYINFWAQLLTLPNNLVLMCELPHVVKYLSAVIIVLGFVISGKRVLHHSYIVSSFLPAWLDRLCCGVQLLAFSLFNQIQVSLFYMKIRDVFLSHSKHQ